MEIFDCWWFKKILAKQLCPQTNDEDTNSS